MRLFHPVGDVLGALVTAGALSRALPAVSAAAGIAYFVLAIWDCPAGVRWRQRWRGVYYMIEEAMTEQDIAELKRKLDDIRTAREDRVLIAVALGLGGAGFAIALLVMFGGF